MLHMSQVNSLLNTTQHLCGLYVRAQNVFSSEDVTQTGHIPNHIDCENWLLKSCVGSSITFCKFTILSGLGCGTRPANIIHVE